MAQTFTYSFTDVQAAIAGPGGSFNIGSGSGAAAEGISVEMAEDKDIMHVGADGAGMHSLNASKAGRITVRLLKTSVTNQKLSDLYNIQTTSSALHGQNVVTIKNPVSGDSISCTGVAFARHPTNTYAKDPNMMEWTFNAITVDTSLGGGLLTNLTTLATGAA